MQFSSARMLHISLLGKVYTNQSVGVPYLWVSDKMAEVQNIQDPGTGKQGHFFFRSRALLYYT